MSSSPEALERALNALEKVVTGDPDCVRAIYYRAQILNRIGRVDAALRDLRKVLRLNPCHADALRELGLHEIQPRPNQGSLHEVHLPPDPPANTNDDAPAAAPGATRATLSAESREGISDRSGLRRLVARVVGK